VLVHQFRVPWLSTLCFVAYATGTPDVHDWRFWATGFLIAVQHPAGSAFTFHHRHAWLDTYAGSFHALREPTTAVLRFAKDFLPPANSSLLVLLPNFWFLVVNVSFATTVTVYWCVCICSFWCMELGQCSRYYYATLMACHAAKIAYTGITPPAKVQISRERGCSTCGSRTFCTGSGFLRFLPALPFYVRGG
jgi:hypothetical protein